MNPKILIIGNTGFLGSFLTSALNRSGFQVDSIGRETLDISRPISEKFQEFIKSKRFTHSLICFAISDVEKCFADQALSHRVNVQGTLELLKVLKENGVMPIFFSSDYVFKPSTTLLSEDDEKFPQTVYGKQKLMVEEYLKINFDEFLLFRTSKLMSKTTHPKNILYETINNIRLEKSMKCFQDQWITPVLLEDIAKIVRLSLDHHLSGEFHLATRQIYSRFELAELLANAFGRGENLINGIKMSDVTFSEPRPTHNILSGKKIESALGFEFQEILPLAQDLDFLKSF